MPHHQSEAAPRKGQSPWNKGERIGQTPTAQADRADPRGGSNMDQPEETRRHGFLVAVPQPGVGLSLHPPVGADRERVGRPDRAGPP
jgi:hypothetical protein